MPRRGRRARSVRPAPALAPSTLDGARQLAAERFGVRALRPEQERLIEAVLGRRDALAILPPGSGTSLAYQLPALLLDRPVVVVSPQLARLHERERSMRARGVPVVRVDPTLPAAARREAIATVRSGGRLVVLTTPETIVAREVRLAIAAARPLLLCVEEAHCLSESSHDFRPAYHRLCLERDGLGIPNALALTATATPRVASDIVERLHLHDPLVVRGPPYPPNVRLAVYGATGELKVELASKLLHRLPRPAIVSCATPRAVDEVHAALVRAGITAERHHGKMRAAEREATAQRLRESEPGVVVASGALATAIHEAAIRSVLHFDAPGSLEQYVEEVGCAGRDGRRAECALLFDPEDLRTQQHLLARARPSAAQLRRVARALGAWVEEARAVAPRDLALSAGVPAAAAASVLGALEDARLVVRDEEGRWTGRVAPERLRVGAEDLAARFETLAREDARRLEAVARYAEAEECRSVFLRRYFGEKDPPRCGTCDRCRAAARSPRASSRAPRAAATEPTPRRPEPGARWTIQGLLEARTAVGALLDELGLEGYLFEIEPRDEDQAGWDIRLEWVRGGPNGIWSETRLAIGADALWRSRDDRVTRSGILRGWRARLRGEPGEAAAARPSGRAVSGPARGERARGERRRAEPAPRGSRRSRA